PSTLLHVPIGCYLRNIFWCVCISVNRFHHKSTFRGSRQRKTPEPSERALKPSLKISTEEKYILKQHLMTTTLALVRVSSTSRGWHVQHKIPFEEKINAQAHNH
ncbi:unnamed protein product, partial [Ectocarpus sp. 12 AP-2014]